MQFDVHANLNPDTADAFPFLLDVQADLLQNLPTRVVLPLVSRDFAPDPIRHLNPEFVVGDQHVLMLTNHLAPVPPSILGPVVASLNDRRTDIIAALDFLFTGV